MALPIVAVLVYAIVDIVGIDLSNRLTDPTNYIGREIVRDIGFRLSMESPLYGHGMLASSNLFDSTYDPLLSLGFHNMYVLTLYDFGIIGLAIFMLTWGAFAVECARRFPNASPRERQVLVTALSILIGVLVFSWAGNDLINFAPSMYLWIILAWASVSHVYRTPAPDALPSVETQPVVQLSRNALTRTSGVANQHVSMTRPRNQELPGGTTLPATPGMSVSGR